MSSLNSLIVLIIILLRSEIEVHGWTGLEPQSSWSPPPK
jgi:hypothetical protein